VKPWVGLLACALLGGSVSAALSQGDTRTFTLEDLGSLVRLSQPALSPDGKWAALIVSRPDVVENRVVTTLNLFDSKTGAQRVIASGQISQPAWAPHGDKLAWLAPDSDSTTQISLYALDSEVGLPIQVTNSAKGAGVQKFAWSPDGESFAYLAQEAPATSAGDSRFDRTFQVPEEDYLGTTYLARTPGASPARLWLISARGGESKLLTPNAEHIELLAWQVDGKSVVINSHPGTSFVAQQFSAITAISIADGTPIVIVPRPAHVATEAAMRVSAKGLLAYQHFRGQDPWLYGSNIAVVTDGHTRDVTTALDRHVDAFDWLPDGGTLLVQAVDHARRALWTVPLSGAARRA
jgi:Tol biopolymer transport system component